MARRTTNGTCPKTGIPRAKRERHGMTGTPEHIAWLNIIGRCFNPDTRMYPAYGGRGITICDEWRDSFAAFYAHVGRRPGPKYSIDRIDTNGNYEPGNVKWSTKREQQGNMRKSVRITHNGETLSASEWGRRIGLDSKTISARFRKGMPMEEVLSPKRRWKNWHERINH